MTTSSIKTTDPDWSALIPELNEWNAGRGMDPETWVGSTGNFRLAVAYTTIFWPRFSMYNDMILHAGFDPECVEQFLRSTGNRSATEAIINHRHIVAFHHSGTTDASHERIIYLGRVLKEIYECKLRAEFPDRTIVVSFDDTPRDDIEEYEITFYQHDDRWESNGTDTEPL